MKYDLNRRDGRMAERNEYDPFEAFFRPFFRAENALMRTDIRETEENYVLDVEMPGFDKTDISVSVQDGHLNVEAKHEEKEEDKQGYLRKERVASCARSFYIGDVDEARIGAKYDKGVLSLTIPKEEKKPENKRIEIL